MKDNKKNDIVKDLYKNIMEIHYRTFGNNKTLVDQFEINQIKTSYERLVSDFLNIDLKRK